MHSVDSVVREGSWTALAAMGSLAGAFAAALLGVDLAVTASTALALGITGTVAANREAAGAWRASSIGLAVCGVVLIAGLVRSGPLGAVAAVDVAISVGLVGCGVWLAVAAWRVRSPMPA